jgi:hypothetical protein
MRRLITLIVAAASAVLISSPAWAAAGHTHKTGSCHAAGTAAACTVSRAIRHPNIIRAHATARPHQKVTVTWSMTCTKRKATASSSGSFTARTPASRKLRHPFRHPRSCTVTVATQLASSGHLHAWLTPRR